MTKRIFKLGSASSVPFTDQALAADEVIVAAEQWWGGQDGMTSLVKWDEATQRHVILDNAAVLVEQAASAKASGDELTANNTAAKILLAAFVAKSQTPEQLAEAVALLLRLEIIRMG